MYIYSKKKSIWNWRIELAMKITFLHKKKKFKCWKNSIFFLPCRFSSFLAHIYKIKYARLSPILSLFFFFIQQRTQVNQMHDYMSTFFIYIQSVRWWRDAILDRQNLKIWTNLSHFRWLWASSMMKKWLIDLYSNDSFTFYEHPVTHAAYLEHLLYVSLTKSSERVRAMKKLIKQCQWCYYETMLARILVQ